MLANDTDADGDPLAAVLVAAPTKGAVTARPGRLVHIHAEHERLRDRHLHLQSQRVFGDSNTATVTIAIIGNDPVITSNGGGDTAAIDARRKQLRPALITTVTATETDFGQTVSYSINGGTDASFFSIDANSGALTFTKSVNFELPGDLDENNTYTVIVRATDSTTAFDAQTITADHHRRRRDVRASQQRRRKHRHGARSASTTRA